MSRFTQVKSPQPAAPVRPEVKVAPRAPRLRMSTTVWKKIMAHIVICPTEVNGFGYVEERPDGIYITDVFILNQTATGTDVVTDQQAIIAHMIQMDEAGEDTGRIKFQWHSHVEMPAIFSGTDTANIDAWGGDWLISLVANVHGEFSCRLDAYRPVRVGMEVPLELYDEYPPDLMAETAEQLAQHVRTPGGFFRRRPKPVAPVENPPTEALALPAEELPVTGQPEQLDFVPGTEA